MKGKSRFLIVFVVVAGLILTGCTGTTVQPTTPPVTNPPADIGTPQNLKGPLLLDSAVIEIGNDASETIAGLIYEPLVRNETGGIVGGLARNWQASEDGLEYTFTLRPNATFQDGTEITSDIVIANFDRWFDPNNPLHGSNDQYHAWSEYFFGFNGEVDANGNPLSLFDGIEKVDPLTFLIHLNRPMPELLYTLAMPQFSILNPTALEQDGANYGTSLVTTIASGPYIVQKWDGATLELAPNAKYFGTIPTGNRSFAITQ